MPWHGSFVGPTMAGPNLSHPRPDYTLLTSSSWLDLPRLGNQRVETTATRHLPESLVTRLRVLTGNNNSRGGSPIARPDDQTPNVSSWATNSERSPDDARRSHVGKCLAVHYHQDGTPIHTSLPQQRGRSQLRE